MECLALESQLQALQSAYELWSELEVPEVGDQDGTDQWSGEDDALSEKDLAQQLYQTLLHRIRGTKGLVDSEMTR